MLVCIYSFAYEHSYKYHCTMESYFPARLFDALHFFVLYEIFPQNITALDDFFLRNDFLFFFHLSCHSICQIFFFFLINHKENGIPRISPNGKYFVKLFVHGKNRVFVVDDRIAIDDKVLQKIFNIKYRVD